MKLKRLLESTPGFENRKFGDKLPTLDSVKSAYQAKQGLKEEEGSGFDYQYFIDNVSSAIEAIEGVEEELVRTLDALSENEDVYGMVRDNARQAAGQARRYINGAQKQLDGLSRMLDDAQRNGEYDA